jgi:hypothetical protein
MPQTVNANCGKRNVAQVAWIQPGAPHTRLVYPISCHKIYIVIRHRPWEEDEVGKTKALVRFGLFCEFFSG